MSTTPKTHLSRSHISHPNGSPQFHSSSTTQISSPPLPPPSTPPTLPPPFVTSVPTTLKIFKKNENQHAFSNAISAITKKKKDMERGEVADLGNNKVADLD
ncbi:hypothetical protein Sjap_005759 [Stephania japonica]|uniref:Uncharacterized protein n=1 Tax=Stephania japonica TaxID=461633 RepID=A0AAP0PM70_9MAGN